MSMFFILVCGCGISIKHLIKITNKTSISGSPDKILYLPGEKTNKKCNKVWVRKKIEKRETIEKKKKRKKIIIRSKK